MHDPTRCDEFRSALPHWLEGELAGGEAAAMTAHAESCTSCGALAGDLRGIAAAAAALPLLAPSRDLWAAIERRIDAPVPSLSERAARRASERASEPSTSRNAATRRWWVAAAAAAALVVTASSAYVAGVRSNGGSGVDAVASAEHQPATPDGGQPAVLAAEDDSTAASLPDEASGVPRRVADASPRSPAASRPDPRGVPERGEIGRRIELARAVRAPMEAEFDREISSLRAIVEERRTQLDSSTVAVIERSLQVIDRAIAESREALASDPASGFLNDQLNYALTRKVELLQTAALLPPRT